MVSQTLLRDFCGPSNKLVRYDILSGKALSKGTAAMGYTKDLDLSAAPTFEAAWHGFENAWPRVRAALAGGNALADPEIVELLRDGVAVHMARSLDLLSVHHETWERVRQASAESVASDPRITVSFAARHGGLVPAGPQGRLIAATEEMDAQIAQARASSFSADAIEKAYADARRRVARGGVELAVADAGEFLISDAPAQTVRTGDDRVGPLEGISWEDGDTIVMPVGRRHAVAFGSATAEVHLAQDGIDYLNRVQMRAAHSYVAWHPDAALSAFADAERTRRPSRRAPAFPDGTNFDITRLRP